MVLPRRMKRRFPPVDSGLGGLLILGVDEASLFWRENHPLTVCDMASRYSGFRS